MNRDSHYYAVLAFARACGFNKPSALTIGYASQFVDDAKINLMFIDNPVKGIDHDIVENRPAFFNMATCHSYFRIKTFNYEAMANSTIPFHFAPGCKGENFTRKLRCREDSPLILDILNDALLENDIIKLGIVLHPYADTFTHQGFSGMLSKVNDIRNCEAKTEAYLGAIDKFLYVFKQFSQDEYDALFDHIMPAYGHAQALDFPDIPHLVWSYEYDCSGQFSCAYKTVEIDNRDRFKRAFHSIKRHLQLYLAKHHEYADRRLKFKNFDVLMDTILFEASDENREENWLKVLIDLGLFNANERNLIVYRENKWPEEAFSNFDPEAFDGQVVGGVQLAPDFPASHWYRFYLSVKWYKKKFFEYCAKYQLSILN